MRKGHAGADAIGRSRNRVMGRVCLRALVCFGVLTFALAASGSAQAAFVLADTWYQFNPTAPPLGGGYAGKPYEIPSGTLNDPYGGAWDGNLIEPHPLYPVEVTLADIDALILQPEPGDPYPVNFLSLPGDGANNNAWITVGILGQAIDPFGPGPDLKLVSVFDEGEVANVYVSTRTVTDPATDFTDADFVLVGQATSGGDTLIDFAPAVAMHGLTDAIQAVKIEGRDLLGNSFGYDLASVQVSEDSITDPGPLEIIPEPTSWILAGLGGLGALLAARAGRRRRRKSA